MKKQMLNAVKDVFKDYKEQSNILDAKIEKINLFKKSNKLEINLIAEKQITLQEFESFEEYLKQRFQIEKISLNIKFGKKGDRPLFCQKKEKERKIWG